MFSSAFTDKVLNSQYYEQMSKKTAPPSFEKGYLNMQNWS